jgi:hypothetical protein
MIETSKSLLAKLLAQENLTVEQKNVATASFNLSTRVLTIPVLKHNISTDLYDLLIGHEVGHALYTPLDALIEAQGFVEVAGKLEKAAKAGVPIAIINVVEDIRIEKKIKNRYPGMRISFLRGYRELVQENFFDTKGKSYDELNFIDRLNLYGKLGIGSGIKFPNETENDLVSQALDTETFDDVIRVSREIVEYLNSKKKPGEKKAPKPQPKSDDEDQPNSPPVDLDQEEDEEQEEFDYDLDESGDDGEEPVDEFEEESDDESEEEKDEFTSETQTAFDNNFRSLLDSPEVEITDVTIPKFLPETGIISYNEVLSAYRKTEFYAKSESDLDRDYQLFKASSTKVVSYLVKEFELKKHAAQYKRASISKTGVLDSKLISKYRFSEDLFRKISVVPDGKSHGMVLFLDFSGSMATHFNDTIKQLLNLVFFCKKVSIPYEVYAFTNVSDYELVVNKPAFEETKNSMFMAPNFRLINLLSSKMKPSEFLYAAKMLFGMHNRDGSISPTYDRLFSLGSTPLKECVAASMAVVPAFKTKYRLDIVNTIFLTDGEDTGNLNYWSEYGLTSTGESKLIPNALRKYYSKYRYYLVDPISKKRALLTTWEYHPDPVKLMLEFMKYRTGQKVVGFFILPTGRDLSKSLRRIYDGDDTKIAASRSRLRKNKFDIVESEGYDEYYLISPDGIDSTEDSEIVVSSGSSTAAIRKAFQSYASGRVINRVVLNRFVSMIS